MRLRTFSRQPIDPKVFTSNCFICVTYKPVLAADSEATQRVESAVVIQPVITRWNSTHHHCPTIHRLFKDPRRCRDRLQPPRAEETLSLQSRVYRLLRRCQVTKVHVPSPPVRVGFAWMGGLFMSRHWILLQIADLEYAPRTACPPMFRLPEGRHKRSPGRESWVGCIERDESGRTAHEPHQHLVPCRQF